MNQDQAIKNVGTTFANTNLGGLTPEQQTAVANVSSAFNPQTTKMGDVFQPIVDNANKNSGVFKGGDGNYYSESNSQLVPGYAATQLDTDPANIRQEYISQFQDRINALNQVYDQQLSKAQQEGKGRVGSGTAILARRGIAGSPRGGAIAENIVEQNSQIESAIQAERNAQLASIYDQATTMAVEEAKARRQAKEQGVQTYISYLKEQDTRKQSNVDKNTAAILAGGYDINSLDLDSLAKTLGVSKQAILASYSAQKQASEAAGLENQKTKAEIAKINSDISKGKLIEISEGTMLYNTETGETFKNPKTSVGGGTGGGIPTLQESFKSQVATQGRQAVSNLLDIAEKNPGIFGRTAAIPLPDTLRSDAYRNYEAQLDALKGNIVPAALTAMREASKTGGALGNVSDKEGDRLAASLGALSMKQSPEEVINQLRQIDQSLSRWQAAVELYGGGENITTAPDGTQVIITD